MILLPGWPRDGSSFARTDKQAPTATLCAPAAALGRRPFARTDKQAVIHRLSTVFGKVIHSFCP